MAKHGPSRGKAGRTLDESVAELTPEQRALVETRSAELHAEVEGLKALRKLAERGQEQIAQPLGVTQPAVAL